ncbi:hypothetical protein ACFU96_45950 [Streptomyces sp. NPDC057620]|uniref:hypothetical protein n=1 Tax=Streptomyces sp. NPDC057620 TaxID=3346185 RepID=UPI0036B3745E
MLDPTMMALASAAGMAVAQAAGTDAWQGFRERVAHLFGRGSALESGRQATLERLDRTASTLERTGPDVAEQVTDEVSAAWRTRFQDLLEDLDETDRDHVAAQLRELVAVAQQASGGVAAAGEGIAIGGSAHVQAQDQGVAAVKMGNVAIGNPPRPGPDKS